MVAAARAARMGAMPAPLDHSPKCPRCSLVGICLPDETRMLGASARGDRSGIPSPNSPCRRPPALPPPRTERTSLMDIVGQMLPGAQIQRVKVDPDLRRLIAPNPETRTLYLNTPGVWVGKRAKPSPSRTRKRRSANSCSKICITSPCSGRCPAGAAVIQSLCDEEIPLTYFSTGGWFYGLTRGHTLKNVLNRIEQFRVSMNAAGSLALARLMVHGKIANQRTLLMRDHVAAPRHPARPEILRPCRASRLEPPAAPRDRGQCRQPLFQRVRREC